MVVRRGPCCLLYLVGLLIVPRPAAAQRGEIVVPIVQGVYVDADGVVQAVMVGDPDERLNSLRRGAAIERVTGAAANRTELRRVSLARLAREVQQHIESGTPIPDSARFLAGIQQIQYVFVYPEENDVVIAGPAEGWETDGAGRVVGQSSRRPVLRLDDLITALRVFPPRRQHNPFVGCSIDQTEDGMRRFQRTVADLQSAINRRQFDPAFLEEVQQSAGMQNISVWGIPPDSRLAMVLVEADYRMKLIGVGLEDSRVRSLKTYYSLLGPGHLGGQKLQRWWFVADYDAIFATDDRLAFELSGQRTKLVGADDRLLASGQVRRGGATSALTTRFAQSFSAHFEELAQINPAFAELQNAFDLMIVSALVDQNELMRAAPDIRFFYDENGYRPERYPVPTQVASAINTKWVGTKLAIGVGGGVAIDAQRVVQTLNEPMVDSMIAQRHDPGATKSRSTSWWTD